MTKHWKAIIALCLYALWVIALIKLNKLGSIQLGLASLSWIHISFDWKTIMLASNRGSKLATWFVICTGLLALMSIGNALG